MKKYLLIALFIIVIAIPCDAANKQFLIPGYGYVDQKEQNEQWLIPGYGYIDEEPVPVVPGGRRIMIISKLINKLREWRMKT